jgi:archaellum component FlaC
MFMENDDLMKILHDRATRGESLSKNETAQLAAWYERLDKIESEMLNKNVAQNSLRQRNRQIQTVLSEISEFTSKIQKISLENEKIRRENESLREKLTEKLALKTV